MEKVRSFLTNSRFDSNDPTYRSNSRIAKLNKNVKWILNRFTYKFVRKSFINELAPNRRYVIYPLHLEPELNIDTCGRYWENQTETILKIWRQLGPNDSLLIKEHPVAIGNRVFLV